MSSWTADNTNSNEMTSTVKEQEVVPRMNTTTTPTPQRLEQALEAFVEDLEGLEGAVQRFEEALLELEEGALKEGALLEEGALEEGAPERQNGPNPILVGQEVMLYSASEPVLVETVTNEPGPTGEPAAPEPHSEADAEANAEPTVLPGLPEAGVELAAAIVEAPPAPTPEHDGNTAQGRLRGPPTHVRRRAPRDGDTARRASMSVPTKHPDEPRRNEIREENAIRVVRTKDPAPENGALGLVWVSCHRDCEGITLPVQEELRKTGVHVHAGKEPPREENPSVVLLCPEGEGVAPAVWRVRTLALHAPVVVFGPTPEAQMAAEALQTGASGFVHAGLSPERIALALSLARKGEVVIPRQLLGYLLAQRLFTRWPRFLDC